MHASVMVTHFREWWLFGLFFALVTPLQLGWAELVRRRRDEDRRLLLAGGVGNVTITCVWAVSRVVGIPFGPEAFNAERVGIKDLVATTDELALGVLVGLLLLRPGRSAAPSWALTAAWSMVVASALFASIGGH